MQVSAQLRDRHDRYVRVPLDLPGDLAEVELRDDKPLCLLKECQCVGGERPDRTDPQKADILPRVIGDHLLDGADGCAVCDKHLLCIGIDHIEIREFLCCRFDLVHESFYECCVQAGVCCARVSPLIMSEPGHMCPVAFPEFGEPGNEAPRCRFKWWGASDKSRPAGMLYGLRYDDAFPHVPDHLVSHQKDRYPEPVCKVECLYREIVHFLYACGTKRNNRIIAMRPEPALHHISLCSHRWL